MLLGWFQRDQFPGEVNAMNVGKRRYVAVLLPYSSDFSIDEQAFRSYVRYFADDARFAAEGGLCINPEAGEIFYLTREEKRRGLESAVEGGRGELADHRRDGGAYTA